MSVSGLLDALSVPEHRSLSTQHSGIRAEWIIPADRMKAGQPHRVPVSAAALVILREMAALKDSSGLVFIGQREGTPKSDMTLTAVLRRTGRGELSAHGFRSTFRDWAAEATPRPNDVVEQELAHAIGSALEAAYRRGDLIAKRRALMDHWANYLTEPAAQVVRPRFGQQHAAHEVVA